MNILSPATNKSRSRLFFLTALGLLTILSLYPFPPALPDGPQLDKLAHLFAYVILAHLIDAGWPDRKFALWKWASLFAYGLLIESIQYLVPNRSFSLYDLAANMAGIGAYVFLIRKNLRLERLR